MGSTVLRRGTENKERDKVLEEIKFVKSQIQNVSTRFEQTSDNDLVEAIIYEMEALKARYRYLMRSAKSFDVVIE